MSVWRQASWQMVLLAPGGCHSNLRFFTRGSVIGGESISLRAFAVINQNVRFRYSLLERRGGSSFFVSGVKELGKEIKANFPDGATGLLTVAARQLKALVPNTCYPAAVLRDLV